MKKQQLKLPKQLWTEESIDLTRHSYQGKLLTKSEGFKLGKTQRKKQPIAPRACIMPLRQQAEPANQQP